MQALHSSEESVMKAFILLLFCCFCSAKSGQITCHTNLRFTYGTSYYSYKYYNVADDVHEGCCLSCENAQLLCYKNMVSHLNQVLGYGVAYIRDTAADKLCNIVQQEVVNTNPMHVYAYWSVNNCPSSSNIMYLGQLCCWRGQYVNGKTVYVNNPECSQCRHPNKTSTYDTTASPSKATEKAVGNCEAEQDEVETGQEQSQKEETQKVLEQPELEDVQKRQLQTNTLENQEAQAHLKLEETQKAQELKDNQSLQSKMDSLLESDFKNFMGDIQG